MQNAPVVLNIHLNSLKSLENGQIFLPFPHAWLSRTSKLSRRDCSLSRSSGGLRSPSERHNAPRGSQRKLRVFAELCAALRGSAGFPGLFSSCDPRLVTQWELLRSRASKRSTLSKSPLYLISALFLHSMDRAKS